MKDALAIQVFPEADGSPQVRDRDRSPDHEANRQCLIEFFVSHAIFFNADDMVSHTVIASKDQRSHETEQFLGTGVEGAVAIHGRIKAEEPLDVDILAGEHQFVEFLPLPAKLFWSIQNGPSHQRRPIYEDAEDMGNKKRAPGSRNRTGHGGNS